MSDSSQTMMEVQKLESLLSSGSDFLQDDKLEKARDCFDKALQIDPQSEKALGLLGLTHFRLSEFEPASGVYQRLVEMNASDASYRLNLGLVHLKLGRASLAIRELSKSRELDPSQLRTVSYLGLAHARNGEYAQAFEAFLRADEAGLASEMEQYLEAEDMTAIRTRVEEGGASESEASDSPVAHTSAPDDTSSEGPMFPSAEPKDVAASEEATESAESVAESDEPNAVDESNAGDEPVADSDEPIAGDEPVADSDKPNTGDEPFAEFDAGDEPNAEPNAEPSAASGVVPPLSAEGVISRAVDIAAPSEDDVAPAKSSEAPSTPSHTTTQAMSLREFTEKNRLRPEERGDTLSVGAGGALIAKVKGKLVSRTEGVMISSGELGYEPATRRIRGQQSDEIFGTGQEKLFLVTGEGYMVASASGEVFTVVSLDDEVLYLREEYLFSFEPQLHWENGRIPGSDHQIAQFRGDGCVAIRSPQTLLSVRLSGDRVLYVESDVLAGWTGKVVPRVVKPAAGGLSSTSFVECSGEGAVLMHDLQDSK